MANNVNIIETFSKALLDGGSAGIISLTTLIFIGLLCIIGWLIKDRKRILKIVEQKDNTLKCLIDKYSKSSEHNVNAISALKEVLIELKLMVKYRNKDGNSNE